MRQQRAAMGIQCLAGTGQRGVVGIGNRAGADDQLQRGGGIAKQIAGGAGGIPLDTLPLTVIGALCGGNGLFDLLEII